MIMDYYFSKTLKVSFEEAIVRVTEALKKDGFGVLTEIDVKETLKKKLNVDFRNTEYSGLATRPLPTGRWRRRIKSG
jgi:uncharacterized protein (DUF302 family)